MRILQIGYGQWGKNHARLLNDMGRLTAVSDFSSEQCIVAEENLGVRATPNLRGLLDSETFDIAIITTPTSTHYDVAKLCLLKGINVFVEKPFTTDIIQGKELIDLAREKGLKITCGYIERFNPVTKYILDEGVPNLIEFHRESELPIRIKDAGIVMDTAVHDIDTACWIFGDFPKRVTSVTKSVQGGAVEDMSVITLEFADGIANIVSNWNTKIKMRLVHATYPDSVIRGDFVQRTIEHIEPEGKTTKYRYDHVNPLKNELEHFIRCVEDNEEPLVSAEHANIVTSIAQTALQSMRLEK